MKPRWVVAVVVVGVLPSAALACLWDYDTLKMERQRFPGTLELITGKFLRHTPEFYEWRIKDRLAKIRGDPNNLAYLDDLGVAYDKTGQHQKAIETALLAEKIRPGRYETEANLGTFLIHSGKLEEGLKHIDRAILINPNAHFGREKYQKYLVVYVLTRRADGRLKLPLKALDEPPGRGDFTEFVRSTLLGIDPRAPFESERQAALKGVQGMMKFGHYDSPVLLEALGSLLQYAENHDPTTDAKRLAARAYLKASYEAPDEEAKAGYRKMASETLSMQTRGRGTDAPLPLEELEQDFQRELTEAREWYEELRQNELAWIRDGKNPEQEFDRLYYEEPAVSTATEDDETPPARNILGLILFGLVVVVLFGLVVFAGVLAVVRLVARMTPHRRPAAP
jgi:tetratricopeptide (TPR) repeat protein